MDFGVSLVGGETSGYVGVTTELTAIPNRRVEESEFEVKVSGCGVSVGNQLDIFVVDETDRVLRFTPLEVGVIVFQFFYLGSLVLTRSLPISTSPKRDFSTTFSFHGRGLQQATVSLPTSFQVVLPHAVQPKEIQVSVEETGYGPLPETRQEGSGVVSFDYTPQHPGTISIQILVHKSLIRSWTVTALKQNIKHSLKSTNCEGVRPTSWRPISPVHSAPFRSPRKIKVNRKPSEPPPSPPSWISPGPVRGKYSDRESSKGRSQEDFPYPSTPPNDEPRSLVLGQRRMTKQIDPPKECSSSPDSPSTSKLSLSGGLSSPRITKRCSPRSGSKTMSGSNRKSAGPFLLDPAKKGELHSEASVNRKKKGKRIALGGTSVDNIRERERLRKKKQKEAERPILHPELEKVVIQMEPQINLASSSLGRLRHRALLKRSSERFDHVLSFAPLTSQIHGNKGIGKVPDNAWELIIMYLSIEDIFSMSRVCRRLFGLTREVLYSKVIFRRALASKRRRVGNKKSRVFRIGSTIHHLENQVS